MLAICGAAIIILTAISFIVPFQLSNTGNFYARNEIIAERQDAFQGLRQFESEEAIKDETQPQQSQPFGGFSLIYIPRKGDNVFTPTLIEKMKAIEAELRKDKDWTKFCLRKFNSTECQDPSSPVTFLGFFNKTTDTLLDVPARLQYWADNEKQLDASGVSYFFGRDFSKSNPKSLVTRANLQFGGPHKGYKNMGNRTDNNKMYGQYFEIATRWDAILNKYRNDTAGTKDPDLQVLYFGDHVTNIEVNRLVFSDMSLFAIAVGMVLIIISIHTGSQYIGLMSITHIVSSVLVAYFFYRVVLWNQFMLNQNLLALFIVLGVGADDVFVFKDAWMQSYQGGPIPNKDSLHRLAWTWNRSVTAMTTTSFTTAVAFFATAVNPIPSIRALGVFTALCILVNFALVITWFPAVIIIWHRNGWDAKCCCKEQESPAQRMERVKNIDLHEIDENDKFIIPGMCGTSEQVHTHLAHLEEYRPIEKFFHQYYTPFLHQWRFVAIFVSITVVAVCSGYASTLKVHEGQPSYFPDDYFLNVFSRYQTDYFRFSNKAYVIPVHMVWGISGIDRTGLDGNDERNKGVPTFYSKDEFKLASPDSQMDILNACDNGAKLSNTLNGQVKCFMRAFKQHINETGGTFPVPEGDFVSKLEAFSKNATYKSFASQFNINQGRVRYAYIEFNSSMPLSPSLSRQQKEFSEWAKFTTEQNSNAKVLKNGFNTCWVWTNMRTMEILVESALAGAGASLALAFVVLCLVSMNWIISFMATFSIASVVICIMGIIPMMGLELGMMESICITVLVGLSVDFVVHLAIAYKESKRPHRYEKVQDSFTELGVSIVGGALTTMSTTAALFGTTLLVLYRFGQIILIAISLSFFFANVLFMAMMLQWGPEGDSGNLKVLWNKLTKKN
eukprot:TRINITY_DN5158_c0_g1_i4.p1 TRINITY_DN5158_c0_g1~~TRINITY_DN5158_c0_g1_i4.p1  ORF type:complete len:898 (+),score=278.51 TRINITY_DN5158_c0_g1_i4:1276-3969(+)